LRWWHPTSATKRLQDRIDAASALRQAAVSAKIKCGIAEEAELMQVVKQTGTFKCKYGQAIEIYLFFKVLSMDH